MRDLPPYCDPRAPEFRFQPPIRFSDVRVTAFPLRADWKQLQRLCDATVNLVPPDIAYFRVPAPFVFLMLLDYGQLQANQKTHFGAFSQKELLFLVPLEQYKKEAHGWVFQGWASFAPFIYVDDAISAHLGRTVMGWRKSLVRFAPSNTGWLRDPAGESVEMTATASVCPRVYEGRRFEERTVISVTRRAMDPFRAPFDASSPWMPWNLWQNVATGSSQWFDLWTTSLRNAMAPPSPWTGGPDTWSRMLQASTRAVQGALGPSGFVLDSINLKQFRQASDPRFVCYQGLTSAPVRYGAVSAGGLLGEPLFDPGGGYTIDIVSWPTFPVVEQLGLLADGASPLVGPGGPHVSRFRPLYPFWYRVDIEYGQTTTLAARGPSGPWRRPEHGAGPSPSKASNDYDTYKELGSPVMTGPFQFASSTVRIFPIRAERSRVQEFVDRAMNHGVSGEPFLVAPSENDVLVYLVQLEWGAVTSESNDVGDWSGPSVSFVIPVVRGDRSESNAQVQVIPAYSFASSEILACTMSELYGVPTTRATFAQNAESVGDHPMERNLLRLFARTLPALYEGQMAQVRPLLSLSVREDATYQPLSNEDRTVLVSTLKQFRDAELFDAACYQRLVQIEPFLSHVEQAKTSSVGARLTIDRANVAPVVERLGLRGVDRVVGGSLATVIETEPWLLVRGHIRVPDGRECDPTGQET